MATIYCLDAFALQEFPKPVSGAKKNHDFGDSSNHTENTVGWVLAPARSRGDQAGCASVQARVGASPHPTRWNRDIDTHFARFLHLQSARRLIVTLARRTGCNQFVTTPFGRPQAAGSDRDKPARGGQTS